MRTTFGFLSDASRLEDVASEGSNVGLWQPQMWQRGDKYGIGAHLLNFAHSHMASDAPQSQITALQKHHANLKQKHFPLPRKSTLSVVQKFCGSVESGKGDLSCTRKEKSSIQDVGLWFGVFGFEMVRVRSSTE